MTRIQELLDELALRGISVALAGTHLRFQPRSALDAALIARLVACKAELRAALGAGISGTSTTPPAARPTVRPAAPPTTRLRAAPLDPAERWILHALAISPDQHAITLHRRLDQAIAALLDRREIRARADDALTLDLR